MFSLLYSIIVYLLEAIVTLTIVIHIYLLWIFIKKAMGKRVEPDGRKAIIVTGSTSGLGLVMAKYFYGLGFTVIGTCFNKLEPGFRQLQLLSEDKASKAGKDNKLFLIPLDVSSQDKIELAKQEINIILDSNNLELFCLINNAGIAADGPFQWCDMDGVKKVVETNLLGIMILTRLFLLRIIQAKGRVVNVSSGLHCVPCMSTSVYGATKSAIAYFSDSLHYDIRPYGASCRCIVPGNLLSSTNIAYTRVKAMESAIDKLSEEEKRKYRKSILILTSIQNSFVGKANKPNKELGDIHQVNGPKVEERKFRYDGMFAKIRKFGYLCSGSVGSSETDPYGTYITRSFDDAVRLINCPNRVFTGNFVYTNYFGPLTNIIPYEISIAILNTIFSRF